MPNTWTRIVAHLHRLVPAAARSLRPAATADELSFLERTIGQALPASFREYLGVCNGQETQDDSPLIFGYHCLLGTRDIAKLWAMQTKLFADEGPITWVEEKQLRPVVWSRGWIAFSDYEATDRLVLDLDPGKQGACGQIFRHFPGVDLSDPDTVIAPSFEEFSKQLLARLEKNDFGIEEDMIVFDDDWI
jgi:cell wall assembly regulator SMI1